MPITRGDIIRLSFTGKLENGAVFDTTDEKVARENGIFDEEKLYRPMIVVVGSNTVVQGLDEDFFGKEKGYKGTVVVPPEKGYGFRSMELIETIPTKKLGQKVEPGMWVESEGRVGVVESVSGGRARIDYNEPLAGKTLVFEYTIEDVIEGRENKVDAIIKGYISPDAEYTLEGDAVTIEVPKDYVMDREWLLGKALIARFLVKFVGLKQVAYREVFTEADLIEAKE
jgi:FKBP-type peptidyl-prolyl cis-trans isomerase 2